MGSHHIAAIAHISSICRPGGDWRCPHQTNTEQDLLYQAGLEQHHPSPSAQLGPNQLYRPIPRFARLLYGRTVELLRRVQWARRDELFETRNALLVQSGRHPSERTALRCYKCVATVPRIGFVPN